MFKLRRHHATLQKIAAKEPGRYAIAGVQFDPNGALAATDGKRLVAMTAETEGDQQAMLIPLADFVEGLKPLKNGDEAEVSSEAEGQAVFRVGRTAVTVDLDEANFPDWHDIVPMAPPPFEVGVNARLLKDILDTVPPGSPDGGEPVCVFGFYAEHRPMVVYSGSDQPQMLGVMMPIERGKGVTYAKARQAVTGKEPDQSTMADHERRMLQIEHAEELYQRLSRLVAVFDVDDPGLVKKLKAPSREALGWARNTLRKASPTIEAPAEPDHVDEPDESTEKIVQEPEGVAADQQPETQQVDAETAERQEVVHEEPEREADGAKEVAEPQPEGETAPVAESKAETAAAEPAGKSYGFGWQPPGGAGAKE